MRKTQKILAATLATMLTVSPIIGNHNLVKAASKTTMTKMATQTPEQKADASLKTLEDQGKKLKAHLTTIYKTLGTLDTKQVSSMKTSYNSSLKLVTALKASTTKTKYQTRLTTQKAIITEADNYAAAKTAATNLTNATKKFNDDYKKDPSKVVTYVNTLKTAMSTNVKAFDKLASTVANAFKTKYYKPANDLVVKYDTTSQTNLVVTLETAVKALNTNYTTVTPKFGQIDSKLLSAATTAYNNANKAVAAMTTGVASVKTSLTNRINTQKASIDKVNKYRAALSAGVRMNEAKADFQDNFDADDLVGSFDYIRDLKSAITADLKYFTALDATLLAAFKKKYYDPANALISKYEKEANVALLIEDFENSFYDWDIDYVQLRKDYASILTKLNALVNSSMKTALKEQLGYIIGEPEPSDYYYSESSPDTQLNISIDSIHIENLGNSKRYTIKYTEDNYYDYDIDSGTFKIFFKNGTTKLVGTSDIIQEGSDSVQKTITFDSPAGTEATIMEYGKALTTSNSLSLGTLFWKVQEVVSEDDDDDSYYDDEDDSYNDDDDGYYDDTDDGYYDDTDDGYYDDTDDGYYDDSDDTGYDPFDPSNFE